MAYGATSTGSDTVPLSSALVPGTTNPIPVGGIGLYTDANSNQYTVIMVEDLEPSGYVALTSPAAATTAATDTLYTFSSQVSHVTMQNNTSAILNFAFDAVSTLGSLVLQPGMFLCYNKKVTVVHLFTAAATNVNGTTTPNIVLLGAL